jgi:hypothetical protein
MTDVLLDDLHDLAYEDGNVSAVGIINDTELEEIEQSLKIALLTGLGEWAFDLSAGVAYKDVIRSAAPDFAAVTAEFRRVAGGVVGVTAVTSVVLDHDPDTRELTVTIAVETTAGATVVQVSP